ncbi:unnamed protein product [Amoebophrya sp. A25]|nr:unnamed protein product [Amoebophrya sp. A25]|eukprot:GSA25T00007105001.1
MFLLCQRADYYFVKEVDFFDDDDHDPCDIPNAFPCGHGLCGECSFRWQQRSFSTSGKCHLCNQQQTRKFLQRPRHEDRVERTSTAARGGGTRRRTSSSDSAGTSSATTSRTRPSSCSRTCRANFDALKLFFSDLCPVHLGTDQVIPWRRAEEVDLSRDKVLNELLVDLFVAGISGERSDGGPPGEPPKQEDQHSSQVEETSAFELGDKQGVLDILGDDDFNDYEDQEYCRLEHVTEEVQRQCWQRLKIHVGITSFVDTINNKIRSLQRQEVTTLFHRTILTYLLLQLDFLVVLLVVLGCLSEAIEYTGFFWDDALMVLLGRYFTERLADGSGKFVGSLRRPTTSTSATSFTSSLGAGATTSSSASSSSGQHRVSEDQHAPCVRSSSSSPRSSTHARSAVVTATAVLVRDNCLLSACCTSGLPWPSSCCYSVLALPSILAGLGSNRRTGTTDEEQGSQPRDAFLRVPLLPPQDEHAHCDAIETVRQAIRELSALLRRTKQQLRAFAHDHCNLKTWQPYAGGLQNFRAPCELLERLRERSLDDFLMEEHDLAEYLEKQAHAHAHAHDVEPHRDVEDECGRSCNPDPRGDPLPVGKEAPCRVKQLLNSLDSESLRQQLQSQLELLQEAYTATFGAGV